MSATIYGSPDKFGLELIGEIDWSDGCYQFDYTVVWKRRDGSFVYGEDQGCSCPSPFEDVGVDQLTELPSPGTLNAFKAHCEQRDVEEYGPRDMQIAALLERMREGGAR